MSIDSADAKAFPRLLRVIEEIQEIFSQAHDLTDIMNEQFAHHDREERERRTTLLATMLGQEMARLSIEVEKLADFEQPLMRLAA